MDSFSFTRFRARPQWIQASDEVVSKRLSLVSAIILGGGQPAGPDASQVQPLVSDLREFLTLHSSSTQSKSCAPVTSGSAALTLALADGSFGNSQRDQSQQTTKTRSGVKRFREVADGGSHDSDYGAAGISFCMRSISERMRLMLNSALRMTMSKTKAAGISYAEAVAAVGKYLDCFLGANCCDFVLEVPPVGNSTTKTLRLLITSLSAAGFLLPLRAVPPSSHTAIVTDADAVEKDLVVISAFLKICVFSPQLSSRARAIAEGTSTISRSEVALSVLSTDQLALRVLGSSVAASVAELNGAMSVGGSATHSTASGAMAAMSSNASSGAEGYVLSESNFRLYCYSSGPDSMVCRVLSHFAEAESHIRAAPSGGGGDGCLAYFSLYRLSRKPFLRALRSGISAEQVIKFLTLWAHPVMRGKSASKNGAEGAGSSVVPQAVVDQLTTWQYEHKRISFARGGEEVVMLSFTSPDVVNTIRGLVRKWASTTGHGERDGSEAILFVKAGVNGSGGDGVSCIVLPMLVYLHAVRPYLDTVIEPHAEDE